MATNVTKTHATYDKFYPKWLKARIVYGGQDSVHEAGVDLLPKLGGQDEDEYNLYRDRARFLPALKRTISGLEGTATRKEPQQELDGLDDYLLNIDGAGTTFKEYQQRVIRERLLIGPCLSLVNYPKVETPLTTAQAEALNLQPLMIFYVAENITNWKYEVINNIKTLSMLTLKEITSSYVDEFETKEETQYRVLRLNEEGQYTQQVYKKSDSGEYVGGDISVPLMDGKSLIDIPVFWYGDYEEPPLYDLVTTNIMHYQLKADHNHALHFIGLPTPIFPGIDPKDEDKPKSLGPGRIVFIANPNAKPYYLTYGGDGLKSIEVELKELKEDMAFLGAEMLASDDSVNETATKAEFRNASKTSSLTIVVDDVSQCTTEALKMFATWAGLDQAKIDSISYLILNDFNPNKLNAQDLTALVMAWQNGAFSKQTLFENLKEGEIVDGDKTFEEEEEEIINLVPVSNKAIVDEFGEEGE